MDSQGHRNSFILGIFIFLGLSVLGYLLGSSAIKIKGYERSVTVKGLSEKEYPADIVLWPVQFIAADNNLTGLYASLEDDTNRINSFLKANGIASEEISVTPPAITDKLAQQYGNATKVQFRYTAMQTITVFSQHVDKVRATMSKLAELGKQGIAFTGGDYHNTTEYIFTRLNEVKPTMIEEATTKAREVAEKFAKDSNSRLGKIKKASQGQFSIASRDKNNPHIKKVRVVSTVEYYLSD